MEVEQKVLLLKHKEALEAQFALDNIGKTNSCQQCNTAIANCKATQPPEVYRQEVPNPIMVASCSKVVDDCQATISFYFNFAKSMNLPGTEQSDELDFSSPAPINAFLKQVFSQLGHLDMEEECTADEDKRSSSFRDKIFQRFALLFYFSHYLASQLNLITQTHSVCGRVLEQKSVALASLQATREELVTAYEAEK